MSKTTQRAGWLDRISIRRKLIGAFVIVLGLFATATAATSWFARNLDDARVITDHTYDVLVAVESLRSGMWSQESGLRGYVITGDETFRAPYTDGKQRFEQALSKLQRLTIDNDAQQARLSRVAEYEKRWQNELVEPEFALLSQGRIEEAQLVIADSKGNVLLDVLRGIFEEISLTERQLLVEREARFAQISQLAVLTLVSLLSGALFIGVLAVFAVSRQITGPLGELTEDMRRIAGGELEMDVPFRHRRDEIGRIAGALEHFRQISIVSEATSWVRQNVSAIRLSAQQAKSEGELAQTVLDQLASAIGARYAALFILDERGNRFQFAAGYGYTPGKHTSNGFALGEGLVGQCAHERKPMVLEDVPDNYINVVSGLGQAKPNVLILAPAVDANEVLAVVEIGLFEAYRERHEILLEDILPSTALALSRLKRQQETQELLEETNAQSEELKVSEEELRSQQAALKESNTELRERGDELSKQSEELRASEEELKFQSEELQATNEELRQKGDLLVAQKDELQLAQKELEEKAEALAQSSQYKSEFLANMSHELRTPLNSLLILARSLADNDSGHLDEEEVEAATIVHESGSNLLRLINDILDLSKVEAGKMQAHFETMPLSALRDRLQRNFAHVAQQKQLGYEVVVADDAPDSIITDAGKLEQIVNNLLGNAFKFTKEGTVSINIGRPGPDMLLRTPGLTAENSVCIGVTDQGIGIPEDRREKIFQAFEQVDSSTSRVYGGTGLGLSISQRLAQLLGGEVHLQSIDGEGSTFSVVVPESHAIDGAQKLAPSLAAEEPIAVQASSIKPQRRSSKREASIPSIGAIEDDREVIGSGHRSILIIEDDVTFAKLLRDDARRKGFKCLVAVDGETGIELARAFKPSGVLLDIGLPGIDGWTVLDRLKSLPETRRIPVHILSGAEDTGQSEELGAAGYLSKPVSSENLEAVFSRVLEGAGDGRKRLLVIDDDASARTAIKTLLKHQDFEITYADSGQSGLDALTKTAYECVVLDLNLPDISGFDMLEKINIDESAPPVIVYSGRELTDDENIRLRTHTDSIVVKGLHSNTRLLDEVTLFMHSIRAQSRPPAPPLRDADKDLSGKTVLLVDDDMRNTFALSRVLRAKGLKVLMAQDGYKALDQLERQADIDIVLMDIMMPGMDGYETMRRIRAQSQFKNLPILALTAKAMKGDREKCIEAGASDYLSKPIDTDKLLSMMRAWS